MWNISRQQVAIAATAVVAAKLVYDAVSKAFTRKSGLEHIVLDPRLEAKRLILVGDVHGCFDELKELMDEVQFDKEKDHVILLGDLVNKGPKSLEVVRYARKELGASAVMGNHDLPLAKLIEGTLTGKKLKKYAWGNDLDADEKEWIRTLPYSILLPKHNALCVHAGLVPGVHWTKHDQTTLTEMRNLGTRNDGTYFAVEKGVKGPAWASVYKGPLHIYFGHDAKRGLQMEEYATGLDTACVKGKTLTAMILPERKLVSVPAHMNYQAAASSKADSDDE